MQLFGVPGSGNYDLSGNPSQAFNFMGQPTPGVTNYGTPGLPQPPGMPAGAPPLEPAPPMAAPGLPAAPASNPWSWFTNPTATAPGASGMMETFALNPMQFGTQDTANRLAGITGLQAYQQDPGMMTSYSNPMMMLNSTGNPMAAGMNAGLLANAANMYGTSGPGSQPFQNQLAQDLQLLNGGYTAVQGSGYGTSSNPGGAPNSMYTPPTTNGGGSMHPGVPNIFNPPPIGGSLPPTGGGTPTQGGGTQGGGSSLPPLPPPVAVGGTPDAWLADNANDIGYLRNIAQNAGFATNATPAWEAMVNAQQRNIDRRYSDLTARFAASGNRFSSDFGSAATDFMNQAALDQNSLLGQMTFSAQESARARELAAAQGLGQMGFQGVSQLSNQGFQSLMNRNNQQLQAALAFMNAGYGAAGQMAGYGAQGAQGLHQGSILGAQSMYGTQNQAAQQEMARQLALQQMGLGAATDLSRLWQSNLGLGGQLGQQQYGVGRDNIAAQFNEWLRQQPYNNPLVQMMYQATTGYAPVYQPQYQQGTDWGGLLGGAGALLGGLAMFSDRRLKSNITPIGTENGHKVYMFNYLSDPITYIGVMADEVEQTNPEAVETIDGYKRVNYEMIGVQFREAA